MLFKKYTMIYNIKCFAKIEEKGKKKVAFVMDRKYFLSNMGDSKVCVEFCSKAKLETI